MRVTAGFLLALIAYVSQSAPAATMIPRICTGCDFTSGRLANADFDDGTYVGINFQGADLHGASFRNAKFVAGNFLGADLRGAAFDGADCTACNFEGAKLTGATFAGTRMTAANFHRFSGGVAGEQMRELLSRCVACNFAMGNLRGLNLGGLTLISVDFSMADLRDSFLDQSVMCWYSIAKQRRQVACDHLRGALLAGAIVKNVLICDNPYERRNCSHVDSRRLLAAHANE